MCAACVQASCGGAAVHCVPQTPFRVVSSLRFTQSGVYTHARFRAQSRGSTSTLFQLSLTSQVRCIVRLSIPA